MAQVPARTPAMPDPDTPNQRADVNANSELRIDA
jgi:hypothetical protein